MCEGRVVVGVWVVVVTSKRFYQVRRGGGGGVFDDLYSAQRRPARAEGTRGRTPGRERSDIMISYVLPPSSFCASQALKGHGAPTRLVILPHESHGYEGRESVMHALYEMDHWLERFCRGGVGASVEEAGMPGAEAEAEGGRGAKL